MGRGPSWWRPGLLLVVGVAVALRVAFALAVAPDLPEPGDAVVYRRMAETLRAGEGLLLEAPGTDRLEPSAEHPPAFPALLAGLGVVGLRSWEAQRVALALLSGAGVALVALVGRRVGGPTVGLVAAGLAAVHPLWLQPAGMVMSESLYLVLVPAVLLAALRARERPSAGRLCSLGALIGAAVLTRPEALGLVVVVGLPTVLLSPAARGRRLPALLAVAATAGLLVVPWVVRNHHHLGGVTLTTNTGKTVVGSNCDATYHGPGLGGFDYDCQFGAAAHLVQVGPPDGGGSWDGRTFDEALGRSGRTYVREHLGEVPKVVAARVARTWGLAFAGHQLDFDVGEGRSRGLQRAGQWLHLLLLPFVVLGAVVGLRGERRPDVVLLLALPVLVTATSALVYGGVRMRAGAEPALLVLGALGAVHLARWWATRGRGRRGAARIA